MRDDFDPRTDDGRPLHEHIKENELWDKIRRAARQEPALQAELDRVIVFYRLLERHGKRKRQ